MSTAIQSIEYRSQQPGSGLLFVRFTGGNAPLYVWDCPAWGWGLYRAMVARTGSLGKSWHRTLRRWLGSHVAKIEVPEPEQDLEELLRASLRNLGVAA